MHILRSAERSTAVTRRGKYLFLSCYDGGRAYEMIDHWRLHDNDSPEVCHQTVRRDSASLRTARLRWTAGRQGSNSTFRTRLRSTARVCL
eukprot:8991182-Pyramimonas_sp.AAC.2